MNENISNNQSQSEPISRREMRRQERAERWESRGEHSRAGALIIGAILLVLGAALLLQNMGFEIMFPFHNWWALFILMPAIGALDGAWNSYRKAGDVVNEGVRVQALIGVILLIVCATILLDLSWTIWGPVLIILAGIGVLINAVLPK